MSGAIQGSDESFRLSHSYCYRFNEMSYLFGLKSTLLSLNSSWRGGIHIQSCGHHLHFDCRQSYCETLKQQVRLARDQALDTDHGEFICPMCRQMANALLPVPPEPPNLPAAVFPKEPEERMAVISDKICKILTEEAVHLVSSTRSHVFLL